MCCCDYECRYRAEVETLESALAQAKEEARRIKRPLIKRPIQFLSGKRITHLR